MARVSLRNLTKRFGSTTAVDNMTLDIKDCEFMVILGPSGCGKTTALRCVAGLEMPDEGDVLIDDKIVTEVPAKDRDIAMVFQTYALYPHLTVRDNIAFPLVMRKTPRDRIDRKVKEVAELLHISKLLDRRPREISGGEAQRVALGRAIVREPKAFLMDEPLSNLDAKLRLYMRAELKELQKKLKITTIYVTHDQAEAMTMGDRICIMHQGSVLQLDTPGAVYSSPKDLFVAGFVGSPPMNFIHCAFSKSGPPSLISSVCRFDLRGRMASALSKVAEGTPLTLGVRPETISLSRTQTKETHLKGEVGVVEPLGSEDIVNVHVGEQLIKVKTDPGFEGVIGDEIFVGFDEDKIHVFDNETGNALV